MSRRDGYEPGVPCRVASVHADPARALGFYRELFGWEATSLMPAGSDGEYFRCTLDGRDVAAIVSPHGAPPPPSATWGTHVWVESADEATARVRESGGSVIGEPFDSPGGGRMAVLADPAGAVFCAWQPREHRGAQVVNEPGAWAMSALLTPDPEGAKAFYGAVFGWQSDSFEAGDLQVTLFRLPGFVGGEPEQPVPRDLVATMAPHGGDSVPPHWSVDFWVHDVSDTAARAAELGGSVMTPPYEVMPGFMQAVLADPEGATFTVSKVARAA